MKFGDKIKVTHKLIRKDVYKPAPAPNPDSLHWKVWEQRQIKETEGIIIGTRTLSNGINYLEDRTIIYEPKEYIKVYLVATDLRTKPFFVTIPSN